MFYCRLEPPEEAYYAAGRLCTVYICSLQAIQGILQEPANLWLRLVAIVVNLLGLRISKFRGTLREGFVRTLQH